MHKKYNTIITIGTTEYILVVRKKFYVFDFMPYSRLLSYHTDHGTHPSSSLAVLSLLILMNFDQIQYNRVSVPYKSQ